MSRLGEKNILILFMIIVFIISSCVPTANKSERKKKKGSTTESTNTEKEVVNPTFKNSLNYFQDGGTITTTSLRLPVDFQNTIYLRGEEINFFIREKALNQTQCLAFYYPASLNSKILILKASSREFFNFSTNTKEYYYLVSPFDETTNKNFCLKTGIINKINSLYPGESMAFSLKTVCTSCNTAVSLDSNKTGIYTTAGNEITDISISTLGLNIQSTLSQNAVTKSCQTAKECNDIGFDCCSNGLCVNDKTVKSTTNTSSSEYLQALAHIQSNPTAIYSYGEFYNLCTEAVNTEDDTETSEQTSEQLAKERFERLKELYECTTPQEGEMSICTDTYKNASLDDDKIFTIDPSDKNFTSIHQGITAPKSDTITEVTYGTRTLYDGTTSTDVTLSGINDDLNVAMGVTLTATVPTSNFDDVLKIKYKVDGSCKKVNTGLALCTKYYTQGQNLGQVNDHSPSTQKFNVPNYTDLTKLIKVEIDDDLKFVGSDWQLIPGSPSYIEFIGDTKAYDTQIIKIHYYVNLTTHVNLMSKLDSAMTEVSKLCECPNKDCKLNPVYTTVTNTKTIIDYTCLYAQPDLPPPPLQQQFALSTKTIPVRYVDQDGGFHDEVNTLTPKQEGNTFSYTNSDLLKPNNITTIIGFNEIYGSITSSAGSAKEPKMIRVTKGKSYNIFVDSGAYSSCLNCGNDYYSSMIKLFPGTFLDKGGGFTPDHSEADPLQSKKYRSDDLLFGRACFVPVTMIPYTHSAKSTREIQRRDRMAAQHFLFANGYNRDWYGFDYGAVIGSFDGVTWFAIGNQRRITAKTNKMFIAVNAYFGDLATENSFVVTVSESSSVPYSGSDITTDFDSDGAQCQKYHVCQTDSDCASSLGWDYVCENIGNIRTNWPKFDSNGLEIPGAEVTEQLIKLTGPAISGGTNRCVYRGRGSACDLNYTTQTTSSTFNSTDKPRLLSCSANNYCQNLPTAGTGDVFNNRISRYGKSVKNQNQSSSVTESEIDLFGLGSRIIGRPYSYNGTESMAINIHTNLSNNKVKALCLPGRDMRNTPLLNSPAFIPTDEYKGDQVNNNGMTVSGLSSTSAYYSACSVFDTNGDYINYNKDLYNLNTVDSKITNLAGSQSLSTNSFAQLETLHQTNIAKDFDNEFVTEVSHQKNRCLSAPGSSCFTNLDCAPSKTISQKLLGMDIDGFLTSVNSYEIQFWQEELICSTELAKDNPDYNVKENRCCRETGKTLSIATADDPINPIVNTDLLPGVEIALDNRTRYSRNSTSHYARRSNPTKFPTMEIAIKDACPGTPSTCFFNDYLENQYNTLNETAARTCCSKNWVREFDSSNGGGHTWSPLKMQTINKQSFQCLNWAPSLNNGTEPTCKDKNPLDPSECTARSISEIEAFSILGWAQKFELLGIPQITIESKSFDQVQCSVRPLSVSQVNISLSGATYAIPGFLSTAGVSSEYVDSVTGFELYSSMDQTNYDSNLKKIFSPDKFACCSPLGTKMNSASDSGLCCSGNINPDNLQCALKNYTNISAYFNRYVSSEAASLADSSFEKNTGYIKSPTTVEQLACQLEACASGLIARGLAWTELKITGLPNDQTTVNRFIDGDNIENDYNGKASLFNEGLRWNNNVYCVPEELSANSEELNITDCSPTAN